MNRSQIIHAYQQQDLTSGLQGRTLDLTDDHRRRGGSTTNEDTAPRMTWDITMVPEGSGTMVDTYA